MEFDGKVAIVTTSRFAQRALEDFGGVDILVNAAGIIANGTIENTSLPTTT